MEKIWKDAVILTPEDAEEDFARWGRKARFVIDLACELEEVQLGGQWRCRFDNVKDAQKAQNYAREATELAGWYDDIPKDDRIKYLVFRTSISELGNEGYRFKIQRLKKARKTWAKVNK